MIGSEQGPALGAPRCTRPSQCGAYADVPAAAQVIQAASGPPSTSPTKPALMSTTWMYAEYMLLHDYFGRGGNEVMHRLRALRERVLAARAGRR